MIKVASTLGGEVWPSVSREAPRWRRAIAQRLQELAPALAPLLQASGDKGRHLVAVLGVRSLHDSVDAVSNHVTIETTSQIGEFHIL